MQLEIDSPTVPPISVTGSKTNAKGKKTVIKIKNDDTIAQKEVSSPSLIDLSEGEDVPPRIEVYRHDGGIVEMVKQLCADKTNLHPEVEVISFNEEKNGIAISAALRWSSDLYTDSLIGFANNIRTSDGGSHLDGLKTAITRTINTLARKV
jgi:DNA gyrase/topoisomerase IV subunit B